MTSKDGDYWTGHLAATLEAAGEFPYNYVEPAKAEAVSALVVRCRYGCRVRKVKGLSSQARQAGKTMIGEGGAAIPRHPSCVQLVKPVRCVLKTALSESS